MVDQPGGGCKPEQKQLSLAVDLLESPTQDRLLLKPLAPG